MYDVIVQPPRLATPSTDDNDDNDDDQLDTDIEQCDTFFKSNQTAILRTVSQSTTHGLPDQHQR